MASFRKNEVVKVKRETLAFWADMLENLSKAAERGDKHPFNHDLSSDNRGPTLAECIRNYAQAIEKEANKGKE